MSMKTLIKLTNEFSPADYERIIPVLEGLLKKLLNVADVKIIIDIADDDL